MNMLIVFIPTWDGFFASDQWMGAVEAVSSIRTWSVSPLRGSLSPFNLHDNVTASTHKIRTGTISVTHLSNLHQAGHLILLKQLTWKCRLWILASVLFLLPPWAWSARGQIWSHSPSDEPHPQTHIAVQWTLCEWREERQCVQESKCEAQHMLWRWEMCGRIMAVAHIPEGASLRSLSWGRHSLIIMLISV